jgi:ABC-2 type transport system permease protein
MWRGQYEITVGFLYELWDRNLINIFVSPIGFFEWVLGLLTMGVIKAFISFSFAGIVAFILYRVGILSYGLYLIPFILLLLMNGWWVGFFVAGILMKFGTKVQTFAWTTVAILSPFSGIYYPITVLPKWAQAIAHILPSSYVFEGAREVIQTGHLDMSKIWMSLGLNIIYLFLGISFMRWSFYKIFHRGLTSLQ